MANIGSERVAMSGSDLLGIVGAVLLAIQDSVLFALLSPHHRQLDIALRKVGWKGGARRQRVSICLSLGWLNLMAKSHDTQYFSYPTSKSSVRD